MAGYARFTIGGTYNVCRFGSGSPVAADPSGSSPLSPECLCTMSSGSNSGVIVQDILYFLSYSGKNLYEISDLSTTAAGTSACVVSSFSSFAANKDLWSGQPNDMAAVAISLGTFLVGLSADGKLLITGPVLRTAGILQGSATYWVMPTTNSDADSFNPDADHFGVQTLLQIRMDCRHTQPTDGARHTLQVQSGPPMFLMCFLRTASGAAVLYDNSGGD
eukprot:326271-Prymnesium_polylepis.1